MHVFKINFSFGIIIFLKLDVADLMIFQALNSTIQKFKISILVAP